MTRRRRTLFRVNCEGDTLTSIVKAWDKESVARWFASPKSYPKIPDGYMIRVWTQEEWQRKEAPTLFPVEDVR